MLLGLCPETRTSVEELLGNGLRVLSSHTRARIFTTVGEISIDDKNVKNYLRARLNRKRKTFTAQFRENASSLTADAPSFFAPRKSSFAQTIKRTLASPSIRTCRRCKRPSPLGVSFPLGAGKLDNFCATYSFLLSLGRKPSFWFYTRS
jgi:hypothetical protein